MKNAEQKENILIVDDNTENIQMLAGILTKNGYEVSACLSGEQAINHLQNNKPELILMDIMMPEIDGFETCRRIKANNYTNEIPIIFLTAKAETEDLVRGFECGGVDYVNKPFNTAELLARIKTHIALQKAKNEIETLRGIIPICANCKKVRDDNGFWEKVENYIRKHSKVEFSHSICPACAKQLYPEMEEH